MVLAVGAVLLGWLAARRRWTELKPLAYLAMAAGGYRLLLVDLRQDRHAALVLSLLFYGGALILLPRWLETPRTSAG
jgi:sugar phosphate permease